MLDSDDVDHIFYLFNPTTLAGFVLWIAVIALFAIVVAFNENECAQMHCRDGAKPVLMENQCLCVERAE